MRRTFWNNGCQIHDNTSAHFFDYWQKNLQTQFFKLCMHARYEFLQKKFAICETLETYLAEQLRNF